MKSGQTQKGGAEPEVSTASMTTFTNGCSLKPLHFVVNVTIYSTQAIWPKNSKRLQLRSGVKLENTSKNSWITC